VEGTLIATVCLTALAYALKDLLHPDPIEAGQVVAAYAAAGFLVSVGFGVYMRRLGRQAGSPLVVAESHLWIIEGWLSLGVCVAFVTAMILSRMTSVRYTEYVDPVVCIDLSLIFLHKPIEILRESFLDPVDANPFPEAATRSSRRPASASSATGSWGSTGCGSAAPAVGSSWWSRSSKGHRSLCRRWSVSGVASPTT
jgi:predicted Co/Zn/Cd cation transporter (cation efflux family)